MNRLLIILLVFIIIACSGETVSNFNTSDENSSITSPLDNANLENSNSGEVITEKDRIIESIKKDLDSTYKSIELLNKRLESLRSQFDDLNDQNKNLNNQIGKLSKEKLLLEMSLKNLRIQYEVPAIENYLEKQSTE